MKSKTPPTSRNSPSRADSRAGSRVKKVAGDRAAKEPVAHARASGELFRDLGDFLAVGHQPPQTLTPQDETLFKAFQSNLLSMISHELRTPLMGIINALSVFDEADPTGSSASGLSQSEIISMARRNALRLQKTLSTLLDLATIESGMFHARLREVDIARLTEGRILAQHFWLEELGLSAERTKLSSHAQPRSSQPILGDPQKLGRAIDLCLQSIVPRCEAGSVIRWETSEQGILIRFQLQASAERAWKDSWSQALAGFEGGVTSPSSAFSATLQSEQAFLSRPDEGLGSELLLIHEIMRLHHGKFREDLKGREVTLHLQLPVLSSEDALCTVLAARMDAVSLESGSLGSIALVLVDVPSGTVDGLQARLKALLFRASDAVYSLPTQNQVALILEDCKPEDAPKLLRRIEKSLGEPLQFGIVSAPADGFDPARLIELAQKRLRPQAGQA